MSVKEEPIQATAMPVWSDPRSHLLDDAWLLTLFAVLLAVGLPWLVSGLEINFIAVSSGILALAAIHVSLSLLRRPARANRGLLTVLQVLGVLVIGVIWSYAGGLQNPAFLIVFVLPVIGSIFLSRWQPYLMAIVAIIAAIAVVISQAPQMRWYVPGLNTIGAWLAAVSGAEAVPFPGFYAPSAYYVVLLEVFAILMIASALAAEYLGTVFERLLSHVDVARVEAEQGQKFWAALIENLPVPALLVDVDTLRVLSASRRATDLSAADLTGAALFEAIHFSYPDVVAGLIGERGGMAPLCMIRVRGQWRATAVHVQHVVQKRGELALLAIHDKHEEFTARLALDVSGQAVLVIDSRDRVQSFNKPAQSLFAGIHQDATASALLSLQDLPSRWWEVGSGRRKMLVNIAPRVYEVTTSAAPLPGEDEHLYVVTFQPVARAALANQNLPTATLAHTQDLSTTASNRTLVAPQ